MIGGTYECRDQIPRKPEDLFARQVEKVTLSSCGESFSLYRKMGFRRCFDDVIMEYDIF